MLPDFLAFKTLQARSLAERINKGGSLVSLIQTVVIHEGEGWVTLRADGTSEKQAPIRISIPLEIKTDVIRSGDMQGLTETLAKAGAEMDRKQGEILIDRVNETVTNVVHAEGRPLSAELMLEALTTMELQFDDDGKWVMPSILYFDPARAKRELKRLFDEPELRRQVDALVEAGREKWRDRESNRKLVD